MPIPFLVIGAVAAAAGLGMTGHSTLKQRKRKKVHDEGFNPDPPKEGV